jgi:hypothetical protein
MPRPESLAVSPRKDEYRSEAARLRFVLIRVTKASSPPLWLWS